MPHVTNHVEGPTPESVTWEKLKELNEIKRGLRENKEDIKEITWKGPKEGPELKLKGLGIRAQVPCTRKPMRSAFLLLLLFFIFFL